MHSGAAERVTHAGDQTSRHRARAVEINWPGKSPVGDRELVHPASDQRQLSVQRVTGVDVESTNVLLKGDNRAAMAALLEGTVTGESLGGQVKLCYLDPPYNTGARFSTYNDSVSSGVWLGALRDRLVQVRALLSKEGSVWLHLDDSEQHRARMVLDEVFGPDAFVSTIIWEKRRTRDNRKSFSSAHDYIHVYAPLGPRGWKGIRNGLPDTGSFGNPDGDPRGPWRTAPMSAQAGHATKAQFYTIETPAGVQVDPPPGRCWTYSKPRFEELLTDGRIYWPNGGVGRPRVKRYASESVGMPPSTLWTSDFAGDTAQAKKEILELFPGHSVFDTPKPERLLERIIAIASDVGDVVLDPYLGSGTTAVVATRLARKFIGIELDGAVVDEVVAPRLTRGTNDAPFIEYVVA